MLLDVLNVPHRVTGADGDVWAASLLGREERTGEWTGWLAFVSGVEGPARLGGPVTRQPSLEALFAWGRQLSSGAVEEAFGRSRPVGMEEVAPPPPGWGPHRPPSPGPPYTP